MKLVIRKKKAIRKTIKKGYLALMKIKESEFPLWYKHGLTLTVVSAVIERCQSILAYKKIDGGLRKWRIGGINDR